MQIGHVSVFQLLSSQCHQQSFGINVKKKKSTKPRSWDGCSGVLWSVLLVKNYKKTQSVFPAWPVCFGQLLGGSHALLEGSSFIEGLWSTVPLLLSSGHPQGPAPCKPAAHTESFGTQARVPQGVPSSRAAGKESPRSESSPTWLEVGGWLGRSRGGRTGPTRPCKTCGYARASEMPGSLCNKSTWTTIIMVLWSSCLECLCRELASGVSTCTAKGSGLTGLPQRQHCRPRALSA